MKFKNKTVLITGASNGIGRAFALRVAADGATVILAARGLAQLEKVAGEVRARGGEPIVIQADVTNVDTVRSLFLRTVSDGRKLDLVLNNAGVGFVAPLTELTVDQITQMVDVNFLGMAYVAKFAAEVFSAQRYGHLIFTSSLAGLITLPQWSVYCGTKWGISAFADAIRAELNKYNVRVSTVHPGVVKTEFFASTKANIDIDVMGGESALRPEDVSKAIYKLAFTGQKRTVLPFASEIYAWIYKHFSLLMQSLLAQLANVRYHPHPLTNDEPAFDQITQRP